MANNDFTFWDWVKDTAKTVWRWALWLGESIVNTTDLVWDAAAFATDLMTDAASDLTWTDAIRTSLSANKWILDKTWDHLREWFTWIKDEFLTAKSDIWKTAGNIAWFIWELFAPMWGLWKIKSAGKMLDPIKKVISETPEALNYIKWLVSKGEKISPKMLEDAMEYINPERAQRIKDFYINSAKKMDFKDLDLTGLTVEDMDNANKVFKILQEWWNPALTKEFSSLPEKLRKFVVWNTDQVDDLARKNAWDMENAALKDSIMKKRGIVDDGITIADDVPVWKTPSEFKAGRAARMDEAKNTNMIDNPVGKTAEEFKAGRLANISEKEITKDSKLSALVEKWKAILSRYSPKEIDEFIKNNPILWGKALTGIKLFLAIWIANEWRNQWEETVTVDNNITMPEVDKKDMPVNAPDMSRSEEDPATISDKKKELELLKEKNAWYLNMSTSVVDLMKGLGVDSKQEARKLIFEKMTGKPYTASAEDNIKLKSLIEEAFSKGTLPDYFPSLKR